MSPRTSAAPALTPPRKAGLTTASTVVPLPFQQNRFVQRLSAAGLLVWVASAIHPTMLVDWYLENVLAFFLVGLLVLTYRWLPLSDLSYLLIFAFFCIHEWGANHKYTDVPLGEWMKNWLHTSRNHYDRVAHFCFGLLIAYPVREVLMRTGGARGFWRYYLPVDIILAASAFYELLEAGVGRVMSPEAGEAFVGMQGDIWDAQKDMALALAGATIAMLVLAWRKRASAHRAYHSE